MAQPSAKKHPRKSSPSGSKSTLKPKIKTVALRDLASAPKNARFMDNTQFTRLTENIKKDGFLSSVPLVAQVGDQLEIISGHHRVQAAIAAGVQRAQVMVLEGIDAKRRVAMQLAHNAVVGEDDPNVLRELHGSLTFEWQEYSGLSDEAMDADDLDMSTLTVKRPFYQELHIAFLPEDAEAFEALLERIEKAKKKTPVAVAHYEDFDALFDALVKVKEHANVRNRASALRVMAELAVARIEQLERETEGEEGRAAEAA